MNFVEDGSGREITRLLGRWRRGDVGAEERLLDLIYPELRGIAARRLPEDERGFTLETADLVHEAYIKLLDQGSDWQNRAHFFAVAARVMRRIVVDYARRRGRSKRGGDRIRLSLDEAPTLADRNTDAWLELDSALAQLARIDERAARVVELRFFAGMTVEEVAGLLETSPATVARSWRFARAWLLQRIGGSSDEEATHPDDG